MTTDDHLPSIDCHAHIVTERYLEALRRYDGQDPALRRVQQVFGRAPSDMPTMLGRLLRKDALSRRLADMDTAGVQVQVLMNANPYPWCSDPEVTSLLSGEWNDGAHELAIGHPGRFAVFAALPFPHVDAVLAEVQRVAHRPTVVGVAMTSHVQGVAIDDERWHPVFESLNALEQAVFLHPDRFCANGVLDDHDMTGDLGPVFDDTIAVVRLYSSGLLRRFPRIRWIVPHLGGTLPFVLERLDSHWERDRDARSHRKRPSESLDGIWFDTAGHEPRALRLGCQLLGSHRVVLGTDYPMVTDDDIARGTEQLRRAGLSADDHARVSRLNALDLLPGTRSGTG